MIKMKKTFNQKVEELKQLKTMLAELQNEIATAEDEIKKEMTAQGKEEIITDTFIVRYKTVSSNRIDTVAIKKDLPKVAEKYTKQTIAKRFTIV